jgi:hypothetical protein
MKKSILTSFLFLTAGITSMACTNFLITKGATTDGSAMITYSVIPIPYMENFILLRC